MTTPTRDLLIALSRTPASPSPADTLRCAHSIRHRWDALLTEANREGMTGLLYLGLQQAGCMDGVPASFAARISSVYYHTMRFNLRLMADLEEILQESSRIGLEPIVLQGMALQGDVYPDPGMRPMSDIDLWVDGSRFVRFATLLGRMGYRQDAIYPGAFSRGPTKLDVHTHLFWADRLKSRKWLIRGSVEGFIENAEPFQIGATTARRLCAEDQVLYLGMHALKHNSDRLIWLVDIARLLAIMTDGKNQRMRDRAEAFGLTRQTGYVGYLIGRLLGEKTGLETWAEGMGPLASWVLRRRDSGNALPVWAPLVLFTTGKDLRIGAMMMWEMLFPDRAVLRQVFADTPSAPLWRLYIRRLTQFGRMLK
ncbi:MAG: nucleotidyltransferase family protein [Pseudomonadota bacterium]